MGDFPRRGQEAGNGLRRRSVLAGLAGGLVGGLVGGFAGLSVGSRLDRPLRSFGRRALGLDRPESAAQQASREAFGGRAARVREGHRNQTSVEASALVARYRQPVFGAMPPWQAVERLALCVDPIDEKLYCTSQLLHVRQILAGMEQAGVDDPDFFLMAALHDLGKLIMLNGEAPRNVVGRAFKLGDYDEGIGLYNMQLQFSHPEFMYMRVKGRVPEHVAWVVRHHNIEISECDPHMDARDLEWKEAYLLPFRRFDTGTKSPYDDPEIDEPRYRALLDETFAGSIII